MRTFKIAILTLILLIVFFGIVYLMVSRSHVIGREPKIVRIWIGDEIFSPITPTDVDHDGSVELIFGTWEGNLYVFDFMHNETRKIPLGEAIEAAPAVGDLNRDGFPEIVVGTWDGKLRIVNVCSNSTTEKDFEEAILRGCSLADVNNDEKLEVLLVLETNLMLCLNYTGNIIWEIDFSRIYNSSPVYSRISLPVGDVDNDGFLETAYICFVQAKLSEPITLINALNGEISWITWQSKAFANVIIFCDVNNDGKLEICVSGLDYLYIFDYRGNKILEKYLLKRFSTIIGLASGDLNKDNYDDIIILCERSVFALNGKNFNFFWSVDLDAYFIENHPILADVNGDGVLDVIVASWDGKVYFLDGKNGSIIFHFNVNDVPTTPCACDIDGDGFLEICVGAGHYLYIINTNGTFSSWYSYMSDCMNHGNSRMLVFPFQV